jgi:REP element-mobilizing transposase RayT
MPRRPRIEIGGGLYHVIARGNNRRKIFRSHDDYLRLTAILESQKSKLPFYLYAYYLSSNSASYFSHVVDWSSRVSGPRNHPTGTQEQCFANQLFV